MREAGVHIVRIGIEAFGNKMLRKMNKGVTTIENIAALKYCQEFGILPFYNIIVDYPNEDSGDLRELSENLPFLKGFTPPISIQPMALFHGSPVYHHPQHFGIQEIKISKQAYWRFPQNTWQTLIPFLYDYNCINDKRNGSAAWKNMFADWLKTGEKRMVGPLLYYQETQRFMILTDLLSEKWSRAKLARCITGKRHRRVLSKQGFTDSCFGCGGMITSKAIGSQIKQAGGRSLSLSSRPPAVGCPGRFMGGC